MWSGRSSPSISASSSRWLDTLRWEPSLGELMTWAVSLSGLEAMAVVEPPPSKQMAVTQPSSAIRWASTFRDAPML